MDILRKHDAKQYLGSERDACAIYAAILKNPGSKGASTPLWAIGLKALDHMDHRAGWVDGRSDGTGLLVDIPRATWQKRFEVAGLTVSAFDDRFWVLTLALPVAEQRDSKGRIQEIVSQNQFRWLTSHVELTDDVSLLESHALWYDGDMNALQPEAFAALEKLETAFPVRIASFSPYQTVLKVTQSPDVLASVIENEWNGAEYLPRAVIGHNRFSTNTTTDLSRVQPFLGLAHNGEINTIDRLQSEMTAHGIHPITAGSDSQNLDRLIWSFVFRDGLSHGEAVRMAIAPSPAILNSFGESQKQAWQYLQSVWNPVSEGPAAIVHRLGNSVAAAVDALGLRPLWLVETDEAFILSSEPGVVPVEHWVSEPRILGPGEMLVLEWEENSPVSLIDDNQIFDKLFRRVPSQQWSVPFAPTISRTADSVPHWQLVADGWKKDDIQLIHTWADGGHEPIGSLGYDGPLAPFIDGPTNYADFMQETVAVVTNPALDREREGEHFRLHSHIGRRPSWQNSGNPAIQPLVLQSPWLTDAGVSEILTHFTGHATVLHLNRRLDETELDAANRLELEAQKAVSSGTELLVLDDEGAYQKDVQLSLDPALAISRIDSVLRSRQLRRQCGIIVRSGMIRHLHDSSVLLGLGANALDPYSLWAQVASGRIEATISVMNAGLEKILSTMGIHELTGYGRIFSAIGLPREIAQSMDITSFAAPEYAKFTERRNNIAQKRNVLIGDEVRIMPVPRATPHVYKAVNKLSSGQINGEDYLELSRQAELKHPIALRHTLGFIPKRPSNGVISLQVGEHDLPFIISSMSFGSQGETAFRSYAEAAKQLNMLSMNGEGGEPLDMIGKYYRWRGHQVASGRFGVNTKLINGAAYAEIKIGQGAKPGEGGHLPGKKVSKKVAAARSAVPGIDLISPSNNHDLYSIEDLKQLIEELKEANPSVKVIVKVPVVPNIGTIAVGIVKAGADVITLSGFEGGTGAARMHALRHVGLPSDIGVPLTHTALLLAGLRDRVEIWADGGMRNADDVVRMILLGANRVGFGTLSMVALGCTICRSCQSDTCHVGITTQIDSLEEAHEKGLKKFSLQELDPAVEHLVRFFSGLAEGVKENLRSLGLNRISRAVGQYHLLQQARFDDVVGYGTFLNELAELVEAELGNHDQQAVGYAHNATPYSSVGLERGRTIGTGISGQRARKDYLGSVTNPVSHVAGQGFGAFLSDDVHLIAHGGAQDGVGKGASGGSVAVLKAKGLDSQFHGGHVGKSLAYGAQGGTFVIQGSADARAGIRLAGADVIILGEGLPSPKEATGFWDSSLIKGFGFEYMTRGRGLVLGDPGPWLASGMTGGVLYLYVNDALGLSKSFIESRLARAAKVTLVSLTEADVNEVHDLLEKAIILYENSGQGDKIARLQQLQKDASQTFLKLVPQGAQADPNISTE